MDEREGFRAAAVLFSDRFFFWLEVISGVCFLIESMLDSKEIESHLTTSEMTTCISFHYKELLSKSNRKGLGCRDVDADAFLHFPPRRTIACSYCYLSIV